MDLEPLARLRTVLASFPAGLAYEMSGLVYDPSSRAYDWAAIENSVGVGLPADYKRLMDGYGSLVVGGIFIVSPDDFLAEHERLANDLRDWFADEPEGARPIHPEPDGLLLCASTEGRDILWWDTSNPDPDRWPILWDVEFDRHTFNGTLTELLVADLTGTLDPQLTAFTVGE
ncbi:SUKH superfamily protein [Actinocrispum wychmicini]|uniref:SUKH superfamily protein n=2 Tax=Actinocrispum wychmicini TaxID=1213861 RepID=A0A4R2JQQ4_9PSEU|nr:SUKH superfamily protein [Actinocrispum wychmicini]